MRCIIPAAGYGTRVGMKPNQSKEMLPDPGYKRQPIIQYSLDLCKAFNMDPIVITREDKKDLRQYLYDNQIEEQLIDVKGEWDQTVLASQIHWYENNMLILPDTRFSSFKCIEDIQRGLKLGNNAVMALHEVTDPSKWGIIDTTYSLWEKPKGIICGFGKQWAWGLIGFKDMYGQELFSNVQYSSLKLKNVGFTYLDKFEDITRNGK